MTPALFGFGIWGATEMAYVSNAVLRSSILRAVSSYSGPPTFWEIRRRVVIETFVVDHRIREAVDGLVEDGLLVTEIENKVKVYIRPTLGPDGPVE
jgi:hypothetical protein